MGFGEESALTRDFNVVLLAKARQALCLVTSCHHDATINSSFEAGCLVVN